MRDRTKLRFNRSKQLLQRSRRHLAGGVSSGMRALCKPHPLYFRSGNRAYLIDVDGNRFVDYSLAWGPMILGHSHPAIVSAVEDQVRRSHLYGAQSELEIAVAERICRLIPCADMVAFSTTGSEAVQVAFRLARAYTGRRKIIRFEGHYHGWLDNELIGYRPKQGPRGSEPELATEGQSRSAFDEVTVLPWNDLDAITAAVEQHHDEIAGIIAEPIVCNCSCLMPTPGYLQKIRELARRYGIVLIFDEVITGFRVSLGGAQSVFRVIPDIATFGKALGGGLPISLVAGRADILNLISDRRVVHAGTFNGNPLALAAALATLRVLSANNGAALIRARRLGEALISGIRDQAAREGIPLLINGVGTAFHISFTTRSEMRNYWETLDCDIYARDYFIKELLQQGVYLLPDGRWYVSAVHTQRDVEVTLQAVRKVFSHGKWHLVRSRSKVGVEENYTRSK
jgi:glutamate-1-semialdehyde 2,1-aminomutase